MLKIKIVVFIVIALLIAGCGMAPKGTGPLFSYNPPITEKANVYHYRSASAVGGGQLFLLYMNKEFVTIIGNGGYYPQNLLPGDYEYAIKREVRMPIGLIGVAIDNARAKAKSVLEFTAEPNKSYYFRWNAAKSEPVESVEEDIALIELEGLKQFEFETSTR